MNTWKEFQGKTIDDAIREACGYFGVERERLEIEIVHDATSGIFGLMGGKKASIRASRVSLSDLLAAGPAEASAAEEDLPPDARPRADAGGISPVGGQTGGRSGKEERSAPDRAGGRGKDGRMPRPAAGGKTSSRDGAPAREEEDRHPAEKEEFSSRGRDGGASSPHAASAGEDAGDETAHEDFPEFDPRNCDQAALLGMVTDVVSRLVRPIVGEMTSTATLAGNRVRVSIDCGDSSGLLLGREGQTLAAVQYIAGRILAKTLGSSLRLQFDTGNYRERQDERLRALALALAERVKTSRRSHSTRPLSAYQRRIIHLTLEGDGLVQTFSKGEGAQRRVVIQLKRPDRGARADDETRKLEEVFDADLDASLNEAPENLPDQGETLDDVLDTVLDGVLEDARNGGKR
jgi:spoIIIJ-associated protein